VLCGALKNKSHRRAVSMRAGIMRYLSAEKKDRAVAIRAANARESDRFHPRFTSAR